MNDLIQIVEAALKRKGISAAKASQLAVGNYVFVKNIKKGILPSISNMEKLARVLDLELYLGPPRDLSNMYSGVEVPWLGNIAAGGSDLPNNSRVYVADDSGEKISAPPLITPKIAQAHGGLVACTVSGLSMRPIYNDGDVVFFYIDDPQATFPEKLIGKDCAVSLHDEKGFDDGALYIKRIRRADSGKRNEFNLESIAPLWQVMENVRLRKAAPIRYVKRNIL